MNALITLNSSHELSSTINFEYVDSDFAAIETWLASYNHSSKHTARSFRMEAYRFLLWLHAIKGEHHQHLPRTTAADMNQYRDFLAAPRQFSKDLLQKFGRKQQPFKGPLSNASARQALIIIKGMFESLRNIPTSAGVGYITMNPCMLLKGLKSDAKTDREFVFTEEQWHDVLDTIELLPKDKPRALAHYHRTRWLFQLLYRAFLRRDEVANLKMLSLDDMCSGFKKIGNEWVIYIVGKGVKKASIVCSEKLLNELMIYRKSLGLPLLPEHNEDRAAVLSVIGNKAGMTDQSIYMICKTIFLLTAQRLEAERPSDAQHFRNSSTHWMRHTGITHTLDAGADPRFVQAQARHSSLKITATYDHKEKKRWRDEMSKLN